MILNNIKTAFRDILKDKAYSIIKIGGLGIGLSACFLIALYVRNEISYDKHYKNTDQIYRVIGIFNENSNISRGAHFQAPLAPALVAEFPEIEKVGRLNANELFGAGKNLVRVAGTNLNSEEPGFAYADQEIIEVLEIPFISGNSQKALLEPHTILVTKKMAEKYFQDKEAVGKSLIINDDSENPYRITGVIENFPANSHLDYNFLIGRYENIFGPMEETAWGWWNYYTYILIKKGTNIAFLEEKLNDITTKYIIPGMLRESGNQNVNELADNFKFELQPIKDIHLKSSEIEDDLLHGDIRMVWLFTVLAFFILLIACINFINLSTAKSVKKSKEVGLKKTIGASRLSIVRQFLSESIIYSAFSLILSLILTYLLLPFFNSLTDKSLAIPWNENWLIPVLLITPIVLGIMAGLYPALFLSKYKPVTALKGHIFKKSGFVNMRSGLVVFQFISTIVLIIVTLTINQQMKFILSKKLGYEKDQVILLHGTNSLGNKIQTFKDELLKIPQIQNATISDYLPIRGTLRNGNNFYKEGHASTDEGLSGQRWLVDADYIETLGMEIIEGRSFSEDISSDKDATIINQSMAKGLNLTNPIGEQIENGWETKQIIGVVKDFHMDNLRFEIAPLCLMLGESSKYISIKFSSTDVQQLLNNLENLWNEFSPNQAFTYSFLDAEYAKMYADVKRSGNIFLSFAILAIVVACLGLFGLAEFSTKERTKEIGVRKVNGARTKEILILLNIKFISWIIIAFVVACPVSWYATNLWLQNFAYRTEINWWIFELAGALALGIAFITVSWHSWRAATRNPVEALRYE